MKTPIIAGVLLALLCAASNAFAGRFEQQRFVHPMYEGYRLDWCLAGSCGGSAAHAWCRWKGYESALEFKIEKDAGLRSPTKAMESKETCRDCDGFAWIVCERFNDKLRAVTPCLGIGNVAGAEAPTCQGEQGHRERNSLFFRKGEKVWILLRLRNLRPGKHILKTSVNGIYERVKTGSVEWAQNISFSNADRNWWLWYASRTSDPGEWTENISIDGERIGYVEYSVREEHRDPDPSASPLQGLRELLGI